MARSSYLRFVCPSCAAKLDGIEPYDVATQVVTRTCRRCGDRWRLVVKVVKVSAGARIDRAEISFVDNRHARRKEVQHGK